MFTTSPNLNSRRRLAGECVQEIHICAADTGNQTAAAAIGRNLLPECDFLHFLNSWRPLRHHRSSGCWLSSCHFFLMQKNESRQKCCHCDTVPLRCLTGACLRGMLALPSAMVLPFHGILHFLTLPEMSRRAW